VKYRLKYNGIFIVNRIEAYRIQILMIMWMYLEKLNVLSSFMMIL